MIRLLPLPPAIEKQILDLERQEAALRAVRKKLPDNLLVQAKKDGFADRYLAKLLGVEEAAIREHRRRLGVVEGWAAVPVSGVENAAYYYSTYNAPDSVPVSDKPVLAVYVVSTSEAQTQAVPFQRRHGVPSAAKISR